jgi:hypothetical protein
MEDKKFRKIFSYVEILSDNFVNMMDNILYDHFEKFYNLSLKIVISHLDDKEKIINEIKKELNLVEDLIY